MLKISLLTDEDIRTTAPAIFSDAFLQAIKTAIAKPKSKSKTKETGPYSAVRLMSLLDAIQAAGRPMAMDELMKIFDSNSPQLCFASTLVQKLRLLAKEKGLNLRKTTQGYSLEPPPQSS